MRIVQKHCSPRIPRQKVTIQELCANTLYIILTEGAAASPVSQMNSTDPLPPEARQHIIQCFPQKKKLAKGAANSVSVYATG